MGNLFRRATNHMPPISSKDIIVEIGSAKGPGGSTHFFADLAMRHNTVLHSIDIDDRTHVFRDIPGVIGYQQAGSEWAKNICPSLNKNIAVLYLDNYDYNYWVDTDSDIADNDGPVLQAALEAVRNQKNEYLQKHNFIMCNQDCVIEHLKQMIFLLPFMSKHSLVICDDTYLSNDCWAGKGAAVVPYLVINGYHIIETENIHGSSYGVMLTNAK